MTQYLLNQVKAASKSWDKIPGQVREAKHTTEKVKKLTEQAGEAVKGVQGEQLPQTDFFADWFLRR